MEPILLKGLRVTVGCLATIWMGSVLLWPGQGGITSRQGESEQIINTRTAVAHKFVLAAARRNQEIWVGTEKGLSLGLPQPRSTDQGTEQDHQRGTRR